MADDFKAELFVPGSTADLPRVFDFVEEACERCGVKESALFDLQLAVEEACCNVIDHAYGGEGGEFSIEFRAQDADVVITVRDRGAPFDPTSVAEPNLTLPLDDRPIGGLGLYLIQQLMDSVRFSFSEDGNTLEMVKRDVRSKVA